MDAFIDFAQRCAPHVQVEILAAVASVESGLNPFAIRINTGQPLKAQPTTKAEAIAVATALIGEGHDLDLGLGGVGAPELRRFNLSIARAFDPCANLGATARLLDSYYRAAVSAGARPAEAERLMLVSFYGRGDAELGTLARFDLRVAAEHEALKSQLATLKITTGPSRRPPALPEREFTGAAAQPTARRQVEMRARGDQASPEPVTVAPERPPPSPAAPRWDIFGAARRSSLLVFTPGDHR